MCYSDYRILNFFIVGILAFILCSMIYTESHFKSASIEERRELLSCIVKLLDSKGVKDEFFHAPDDSRQTPTAKCSKVISVEKQSYWSEFNATINFCYENNETRKQSESHKTQNDHLAESLSCQTCIRHGLDNTNYELIKLHTIAVNQSIIDFKIWQYFTMAPKLQQLLDDSRQLEIESLHYCVRQNECDEEIKTCIQ